MEKSGLTKVTIDLEKLKKLYKKAVDENKHSFKYEGHTLVTLYAKYLIENLESVKVKK